jgi:hypothetical protein
MQSGIFLLRYRTEMTDAGMPMPALVLRMPMPTYGENLVVGTVIATGSAAGFLVTLVRQHCSHALHQAATLLASCGHTYLLEMSRLVALVPG